MVIFRLVSLQAEKQKLPSKTQREREREPAPWVGLVLRSSELRILRFEAYPARAVPKAPSEGGGGGGWRAKAGLVNMYMWQSRWCPFVFSFNDKRKVPSNRVSVKTQVTPLKMASVEPTLGVPSLRKNTHKNL